MAELLAAATDIGHLGDILLFIESAHIGRQRARPWQRPHRVARRRPTDSLLIARDRQGLREMDPVARLCGGWGAGSAPWKRLANTVIGSHTESASGECSRKRTRLPAGWQGNRVLRVRAEVRSRQTGSARSPVATRRQLRLPT